MSYRETYDRSHRHTGRHGRGLGVYLRSRTGADWLFFAAAVVLGAWLG